MATSPLDIPPGLFNPSGIVERPPGLTDDQWRTIQFYLDNPELANIVPQAPGGKLPVGGTSPSPPGTGIPLDPTKVPTNISGGIIPGTETGLANNPAAVGSFLGSGAKASTLALSDWLLPAISAGAGLGGALIQKSAADNATKAQSDAADKAVALTEKMYNQDRADMAPYRNIGAYSLSQLGHLTGMPPTFGTDAVASATQAANQPATTPQVSRWTAITDNNPATHPAPRTIQLPAELQTLRDLGATQQTASSFVRMRAPDGEEADVHPSEVGLFLQHGATRV